MFKDLRETIEAYKARDPAARSSLEVLLLYPGIKAVLSHRRAHWCHMHGLKFLARLISQRSRHRTRIILRAPPLVKRSPIYLRLVHIL